jgi:hypothetical protein
LRRVIDQDDRQAMVRQHSLVRRRRERGAMPSWRTIRSRSAGGQMIGVKNGSGTVDVNVACAG